MDATTHYADSTGVSIAYQVHGEGPLDLVFVPGFVSHVELIWTEPLVAAFFRRLASFARLIVFDKRGQGLSDRFGRPPTLEESMDDLRAVMDATGCERPAVMGISEGGPMSALFAASHPDRVGSLVLYGTYARLLSAADYPDGISPEALDRLVETVRRDWGGPVGLGLWAPSAMGDASFEDWWARLLRNGASPTGAVALLNLYRELDVRVALAAIEAPTLVVHTSGDRMIPAALGRYLADRIAGSRYAELPGRDHLAFTDADPLLDEVEEFLVGSRGAAQAERALATILFTDLVDSTATAAELGDRRWRHLLERHDAAVRRQLALHRGREVKTVGDGFLATFDGPARAIRCATSLRGELDPLGLRVRSGIHTGEVELIGDDVGGIAVNIGARIGAEALAGEVLVSSTVRELVVGSGLEFADRGVRTLKGVPGEWRLFAID
jgi:pimeloyl-ACP methyl ester carboxylesterase